VSRDIYLDDALVDTFPVYQADGYTKQTGETVFTVTIYKDGVIQAAYPITIAEFGSTGQYKFSFTPNAIGAWEYEILVDFNNDIWGDTVEVVQAPAEWGMSAVDDTSSIFIDLWMSINGQRVTDLDSIAAAVYNRAGMLVVDLGIDSSDDAQGVFTFSTLSSNLTQSVEYILQVTATRGTTTWANNLGFARI